MLPEHLYMTDLGKMAYVVLYLPLVLVLLWLVFWKFKLPKVMLVVLAPVLLALPFWDVYMIGRDADRLCSEEGGLHVYKVVEAEGIASHGSEYWLKYGFRYVEHTGIGPEKYFKKYRDTLEKGQVVTNEISEFSAQFDSKTGDSHKVVTKSISRSSEQVVDLKTGEILGLWVTFNIHSGWFDSIFLKLAGSGPMVWHCGDRSLDGKELNYRDLVKATIKPVNNGIGNQ